MRLDYRYIPSPLLALFVLLMLGATRPAHAAGETAVTHDGVTIRVLSEPFSGDSASPNDDSSNTLSLAQLPKQVSGFPVLETETAVVSCTSKLGILTFWTRSQGRLIRQGEIFLSSVSRSPRVQIVADEEYGMALVIDDYLDGLRQFVALSRDGILEIRQPPARTVTVRSALRYALVPSLVGTDLLYDPEILPAGRISYLPSMNMMVGLQEGGSGMLTVVWPPAGQLAQVRVNTEKDVRRIESFEVDTAERPVFVAFIETPNIWHVERLRKDYLETDSAIAWQRPFDARWVGRFFIDSDGYDFPFYFLAERHKLWGRYIRGWFYYPVWFDGDKTMVHFEKKFPPVGDLLIYHLDTYDDGGRLSPVGVMQRSLGKDTAARLLDFKGTEEQVLLEHRNAVCAMTYKIESYFAQEADAPPRELVTQYADDIATFIRLIRERVFQFDAFAAELQELLQAEQKKRPALAEQLKPCEEILGEIRDIVEADLPETSLEEVRDWTGSIQQLTPDGNDNLEIAKTLTRQCRSVAGTQDDMARNLCVVTIRLMEEAARMGAESRQHVRLAEEIIARCRGVLRQPTWWEPCRRYLPKSNPGAP